MAFSSLATAALADSTLLEFGSIGRFNDKGLLESLDELLGPPPLSVRAGPAIDGREACVIPGLTAEGRTKCPLP